MTMSFRQLRRSICKRSFFHTQVQLEHIPEEGNITRKNFWKSLDSFKNHLACADFVAFDLELSGIHSVPPSSEQLIPGASNTVLERSYRRIKHLADKFAVLQVGIALFQLQQHQQQHISSPKFVVHPYNFYIFPRNELFSDLPAANFYCEAAALEFLASHGFDFNLCIQDGISYLSKAQEAEARLRLVNKSPDFKTKSCGCSRLASSTSELVFSERLRVEVEKWYNRLSTYSSNLGQLCPNTIFKVTDNSLFEEVEKPNTDKYHTGGNNPSFTLQLDNHRQVCLAQGVVEKHFEGFFPIIKSNCDFGESHEISIIFTKSKCDLENLKTELEKQHKLFKINNAVGFRHVIDAITFSGKPLVGHNCALDLAHIHNKFISPLPSSVEEFSASLLANFPCIVDTKYLIKFEQTLRTTWTRRQTSLNAVYSHFCKPKEIKVGSARFARSVSHLSNKMCIEIASGFKRYQDAENTLLHEAGYDAFMTGSVFAQICHQLHIDVRNTRSFNHQTSAIADHINFLNLGGGILDLSTGKQKPTADSVTMFVSSGSLL